ncbi:MAG: autoinducer 2 ABC transporter substrate-binding protein [Treponema sp.]|jgi:simple sugar transport system substrate-binding protein/rhamnose transport system substrate-binding protein|nr:autoinducer 2 ABC transporter substrate-binding protein [Treponema sp.]
MKKPVVLVLIALLSIGTAWAKGGTDGATQKAGVPTIVVMPKLVGIPYFNASETGAVQAGKDLGINVIYTGPTTADAAEQVRMLEDLISKGVDAICVAPNDAAALTPVLRRAKAAGIKVLDWDTSADPSVIDISVHQIDDKQYGEHIWDLLVQEMGDTGDYAILTGGLSATNLNAWIDHGLAHAKTKYPGLNLVTDKVPTDEKQQVAYQKTLDLITAYPNLKGIIGISTPTPIGGAQAVQEKGLRDSIAVVGTALPTDSGPYLQDSSLRVTTLWDPGKLGYLTVVLANNLIKGQLPVNGQDIPNVGKISVNGKTVIMGPPSDFTKDNYKNFSF